MRSESDATPDADDEDRLVQADLMTFLVGRHPALTSLPEIERKFAERSYGPYVGDVVDRGLRDLVRAGLLHRLDDFIFPTVAAVHQATLPH